jgi:hypothetical protein
MVQSRSWTKIQTGPRPALGHGPVSAFPGPFALYTISLNFWTMVIWTIKVRFGPWSFGPEKPGLDHGFSNQKSQVDHGHSNQKSQIWTIVNWTRKVRFGPWSFRPGKPYLTHGHLDPNSQIWTMAIWNRKDRFGPNWSPFLSRGR